MIIHIHHKDPQPRAVSQLLEILNKGGVVIVPTDTVYAFACRQDHPRAINRLFDLKEISTNKHLSLLCKDLAMVSHYAKNISNPVFRFMKAQLPGPYTFIFNANRNVDKRGMGKQREIGVRIIDHPLHRLLMEQLDIPLVATSITLDGDYTTDPEELDRIYGHNVEAVVDDGPRYHEFSTILDCKSMTEVVRIVRMGKGPVKSMGLDHILEE